MLIPKIVHTSWKSKNILTSSHPMAVNGIQKLISFNKLWDVQINLDEDVDNYLKQVLNREDYNLIKDFHIVLKTDIWRLLKLFYVGGVYIDLDRLVNKSFDQIIEPETQCVLCTCGDSDFSHDLMITSPGNPIFYNAIDLYFFRLKKGIRNTHFLGPQTYMDAVTYTLFDKILENSPGSDKMDMIRHSIYETSGLQTFREELPYNSFVFQGDLSWEEWEGAKRSFYKENGLKHWTGEW